jgi:hypothetical protein
MIRMMRKQQANTPALRSLHSQSGFIVSPCNTFTKVPALSLRLIQICDKALLRSPGIEVRRRGR